MGLLPSSEADAYTGAHWLSPVTWAGGLSTTVGTKSFQYLNATTTASLKENLTPWSTQMFGAVQFNESLIIAGFKYQVSYKDATTASLCPSPKSYPLECKSGPVGPPVTTESRSPILSTGRDWDRSSPLTRLLRTT
jgi:hypothetical protein